MFIQDALRPKEGSVWRLSRVRNGSAVLGSLRHIYINGKLTSSGRVRQDFDIQSYSPDLPKGFRASYRIVLLAGMLKYYGEIQEVHSQLLNSEI